jgi:hypothetical protein
LRTNCFQSEERLREFSTDTDRNGNVINIPARDRQLGSQLEKRQQEQLQNALELLSSGGEKGAAAMRAFEKASERAQKASEAFLNTFLGSDEDLLNSGRAAALFDAVVKASETGGTGKAKEVLRTADPRARQALNALSGQDDDIKKGLKSALGVSGIVPSTSPEATGVEKILAQQAEAQAALSATTERQITSLDNLSKMLQGDENNAVQQMMNNINQAAVVVNEAAKNMANIPQEIIHQHKIADINVNFIGAANLEVLQEGFKEAIINTVKNEISASNAKLFRNNPNLLPN